MRASEHAKNNLSLIDGARLFEEGVALSIARTVITNLQK
jgi:hypothetical protein